MAAGMEVVILSWHMLQPSQVVRHGLPGEYPVLLLRAAEVQSIGSVGDNGAEAVPGQQVPQGCSVRRVQVLGPAALGLRVKN